MDAVVSCCGFEGTRGAVDVGNSQAVCRGYNSFVEEGCWDTSGQHVLGREALKS